MRRRQAEAAGIVPVTRPVALRPLVVFRLRHMLRSDRKRHNGSQDSFNIPGVSLIFLDIVYFPIGPLPPVLWFGRADHSPSGRP